MPQAEEVLLTLHDMTDWPQAPHPKLPLVKGKEHKQEAEEVLLTWLLWTVVAQ